MLYRRGAVWWTQFKHQGQRFRLSTNTSDFKAASVEARRLRVAVEQERGPGGCAPGVTLAVLEQLHIDRLRQKGLGDVRIKTVANLWRNLEKHLGEFMVVGSLRPADLDNYEGQRRAEICRGEHVRGQTIRRELQVLIAGLRLAKRQGLIDRYPFDFDDLDEIESDTPRERQEAKPRTIDEIEAVFAQLSAKAKTAGHEDMLRLILATGLRLEEFRRCSTDWLRPAPPKSGAKAMLVVPANASKTRDPRTIPLRKDSVATIEVWGPQFAARKFNHALWLASSAANISPPLTPRDLRATYLTAAASIDPLAAQRLGGHSNIATTGLYLGADAARTLQAGLRAAKTIARGHSKGPQRKRRKERRPQQIKRARSSFG